MASQNKNNAQRLEELGILSKKASMKRNDDIEKYLKEKVEKDQLILRNLIHEFKKQNPEIVVNFPFLLQYH